MSLEQREADLGVGVAVQPAGQRGDGEGVPQGPQCWPGREAAEASRDDQVREMRADLVGAQPVPAGVDQQARPGIAGYQPAAELLVAGERLQRGGMQRYPPVPAVLA